MAERVRRFCVKSSAGHDECGVQVGDVSVLVRETKADMHRLFLKALPHWKCCNEPDGSHEFFDFRVEELPAFAVGDAVRVKAGVTGWEIEEPIRVAGKKPCNEAIGVKLTIEHGEEVAVVRVVAPDGNFSFADPVYLEPWNDAEEWDGSKWVAKKPEASTPKHAIVCLREDGLLKDCTASSFVSTNAAFKAAEDRAKANPGKEYVVLQEKGSKRVEPKKAMAEAVARSAAWEWDVGLVSEWYCEKEKKPIADLTINHVEWVCGTDEVTVKYKVHSR